MGNDLEQILLEADRWIEAQSLAAQGSGEQEVLTRFRLFRNSISERDAPPKLDAACWLMSRWITDQMDWDGAFFRDISLFVGRVHQFAKDEAWRRLKRDACS